MKMTLSDAEKKQLEQRVTGIEKKCDAQIVLALAKRCDSYAEIPWKGFAAGAALAALAAVLLDAIVPWTASWSVVKAVVLTLGAGAAFALLSISFPPLGRLLLDSHRADTEARQYAESLFLNRRLYATHKKTGLLLLIGLFERRVVIIPDIGLEQCINAELMKDAIAAMKPELAGRRIAAAFDKGLRILEGGLYTRPPDPAGGNELSDGVIEEEGA